MMNSFTIYLLKASVGVMLISLPYYILLRGDTNLNLKRFFLLGGLILAFLLPFLKLSLPTKAIFEIPTFFLNVDPPGYNENIAIESSSQTNNIFRLNYLIPGLYILGILVVFLKNISSIIFWIRIKTNSDSDSSQKRLLYSENNEIFSLFRTIHLPKSIINSDAHSSILIHEQAHIKQLHFIDLLISEIAILLTWFNPFTWLITRMIKENHEHLADREVLSQGVNSARYRAHLLNQSLGVRVFRLGHSFNYSLTKKRFEMMKNKNSKRTGMLKVMFLLPAILLSLGFLNITQAQQGIFKGNVILSDTDEPATGTSILIKGTATGTVADEEGNFELKLTDRVQVVFSYVGYKTAIIDCKPGQNKTISLEPGVVDLKVAHKEKKSLNETRLSLDWTKNPAIFLDGVRISGFSEVDSDDIESVSVLKDEALIRERYPQVDAKNGVVEIISKKSTTNHTEDEIFYVIENMPHFPGGEKAMRNYIYSNLEYPEVARKKKIEARVLVEFVINKKGEVILVKVIQSPNKIFNSDAIKVIEGMPDWSPGTQRGKAVSVKFTVPVIFKLPVSES